jgi:hypothetical protein
LTLALAASLCWSLVSLLLWLRLRGAGHEVEGILSESPRPGDAGADGAAFLPRLRDTLSRHIATTLLPAATHQGLASLPIPGREIHDPYSTAADLLSFLRTQKTSVSDHDRAIKAIYQLQQALGLSEVDTISLLEPLFGSLLRLRVLDRPIARVTTVAVGALVDRVTMWPLTPGTRVRQPLGVVLWDKKGTVLGKAKVLCS